MNEPHILTIDVGTQSVRAIIFDLNGNIIAKSQVPIEPYYSDHAGWAEQDVGIFWAAMGQACRRLWQMENIRKEALSCVVLTTQRGTIVNVDMDGEPLRPAISWLDQRRADQLPPISKKWQALFRLARATQTVRFVQENAEVNWLAQHQPDILANSHKVLLLSGYLIYKLSGRYVDSISAQVGYVPIDQKRQAWAKSGHWAWEAFALKREQLPDVVQPGTQIGAITKQASNHTGIPQGLAIVAGGADKACEILGSGCIQPHLGAVSYGTTATINTTHAKYLEVIPLIPPYAAALPNHYSLEVQIFRGYWMVSWFKMEFGEREIRIAEERDIAPEALLDELIQGIPAGSDGLILQPYWTPGVRVPGPEARGAIIGFSDVHTRAHIYRAILEGIAYALREASERIVKRSGIPITELRVSGGGSQSDTAMQLTADIFNLPAVRPHTYETSGLGAAINGAVGMKHYRDYQSAVASMVRTGDVFLPNPATHMIYDALYQNVYTKMYGRLKPLYRAMGKP
jgi:sugar (pentulose or hexulose) kinase